MSNRRFHTALKYLLRKLPPLKRRLYIEDTIEQRKPNRTGFQYYFEMEETEDHSRFGYRSPRLPSEENIPQDEKEKMKNDWGYRSIYQDDDDSPLYNDAYEQREREYYVQHGYHIGMGIYLIDCAVTLRYVALETRIPKTDYHGYDVNARNFPLWLKAYFSSSSPVIQYGKAYFGGEFEYVFLGTNAYALVLETLAKSYREIDQKYRLQCQMTIDFLKDVGQEFDENRHKKGVAKLYHCDKALVKFLWNKSRAGAIQWTRRNLEDGRRYYCGVYEKSNGTKREIFVYPVSIEQEYYHTQTPYMYQVKSGGLSRFFLPGSYLGNRVFKTIYRVEQGSKQPDVPKEQICKKLKKLRRFLNPYDGVIRKHIAMRFFTESLLFENAIVFLDTLRWKTMFNCIQWNRVNSNFIIDGETQTHDFWETRFQVGEKSFHIELRRIFLPDVYDSPRDPIFTEIVVNGRARLFHLASIPSDVIYDLYHEILEQEKKRLAKANEPDENEDEGNDYEGEE